MLGIIGGSSLKKPHNFLITSKEVIRTPFGIPSSPVITGTINEKKVVFLARHGLRHTIPPHLVNYRANIWALHHVGCDEVVAFSAMCSINNSINIGDIVIPDQLIDYTWGRQATFFNSQIETVKYTEFIHPYNQLVRQKLLSTEGENYNYIDRATYGVTQGPRYETKAEIKRYQNDGCDLLGMTGMPEASLALETKLKYAVFGLVTNKSITNDCINKEEIIKTIRNKQDLIQSVIEKITLV